ncbi:MAG TPA: tRNA (N(6)-L-threonylcarbamoyladenosine(37)-C(2))-methylthiotransferase MtaB, partial [Chloroflexota bacterium]|nr:tRNA (N(6)-L-threonylcarbamoyladenosine(37)-C(2))-methylthiotransferase MtaB [Chloroflexota bacterium]
CKVNQADSDQWLRQFVERGYEVVDFDQSADAYIVNTCTVTHVADRKSRQLLRHARRQNPAGLVVATGCYASVAPDDIARMSEVDLIVGDADKARLVDLVHERLEGDDERPLETANGLLGPRHRAFVKVSDGCNKFCAFCIVPYARGRERSTDPDAVVARVQELVQGGFREVVLTAVHMGTYGHDLAPPTTLQTLVSRVLEAAPVERLRLSSIEPEDFPREILALWSNPRLCRHFHLALDSGCDTTLQRMRRRYRAAEYRALVEEIRSAVPDVAITTDVMVGFPGETAEEFAESQRFVEEIGFAGIHVFPYSSRRRTTASKLPNHVDPAVKKERTEAMLRTAEESANRFRAAFLGRTVPVLFEGGAVGFDGTTRWEGLTDNYLRIRVASTGDLTNQLLPTRLTTLTEEVIKGEVVGPVPPAPPRQFSRRIPLTAVSR